MRRETLQAAAVCAFATLALAVLLLSSCYLAQEGTAVRSTPVDDHAIEPAELDAGNGQFPGINDASIPLDATARPSSSELEPLEQLDASAELLEQLDGCLPRELALPSSCP